MKALFTIAQEETGIYKESGSSFLCYLYKISKSIEFQERLAQIKTEHSKASHHCYAYRMKSANEIIEFSSDAGEPSGSAGLPILNALRTENLTNLMTVVVRYYGGTKLGIPGLIHAYKTATEDTLAKAKPFAEFVEMLTYQLTASFENVGLAYRLINSTNAEIMEHQVKDRNFWRLTIPKREEALFLSEAEKFHVLEIEKIDQATFG